MANVLLTPSMITRAAIMLFKNTNSFIQNIDRQYDDQFAKDGAKIGTTLRIRLPNDYTVSDGPAFQPQDTNEQSTTITVATQRHVDVSFSTAERTMSIQDYSEIILAPMMNNLAGNVATAIMAGVEGGISNYVSNVDGAGAVISPTAQTVLNAGALLTARSAQNMDRKLVVSPFTMASAVGTMQGLFNPVANISKQYTTAQVYQALNHRWFEDQTVLVHQTGTFSAGGTMSSANQTGSSITVAAITGTLNQGDIIAIDGVNAVNRVTKGDDGILQQFVVTAPVLTGATSISIYPALIGPSGGNAVQYQTVVALPANGAQVRLVNLAGESYRKNFSFVPQAVTMVTADLVMPKNVEEVARKQDYGISMRFLTDYLMGTDQLGSRIDVLFGSLFVRPEWACCVAAPPGG